MKDEAPDALELELPDTFRREVEGDPDTLAVLIHGSRASGGAREDSDWDLIRVVTAPALDRYRAEGRLHEKRPAEGLDVLHQGVESLHRLAAEPGWPTATYATARILFDRTGEVTALVAALLDSAGRRAYAGVPEAYDGYLNSFVRSVKALRRGDLLGARLHAADSALTLVRLLWGLERRWPPYHDGLDALLPELEAAQGWQPGSLRRALLELLTTADLGAQQRLEAEVERLLDARGFAHEWGRDLEPLKTLRL